MKLVGGQAIVEAIVAFAIVVVAVVGLVDLTKRSVFSSGISQRESQATTYLNQGMSWVRGQREILGWSGFLAKAGFIYCLPSDDLASAGWDTTVVDVANCSALGQTEYTRAVTMSTATATPAGGGVEIGVVTAEMEVRWREGERLVRRRVVTSFLPY